MVPWIMDDKYAGLKVEKNYPNYFAWNKRLTERPAVAKVLKDKQAAMSAH